MNMATAEINSARWHNWQLGERWVLIHRAIAQRLAQSNGCLTNLDVGTANTKISGSNFCWNLAPDAQALVVKPPLLSFKAAP